MIKYFEGFLKDGNGNESSMRGYALIIVCACCTMAIKVVWSEYEITDNTLYLIVYMLGIAIGGKAWQKNAEVKGEIEEKKLEKPEEKTQ